MNISPKKNRRLPGYAFAPLLAIMTTSAQNPSAVAAPVADDLQLSQGERQIETPQFTLKFAKSSQTLTALRPQGAGGFDFTPADRLSERTANNFYHLGDIVLRVRPWLAGPQGAATQWRQYSTAANHSPVQAIESAGTLAAADLTGTLPPDCPLQITRHWLSAPNEGLTLRFEIKNKSATPQEIGALGIPLVFNNIITGRNLKQAHEVCSFSDPYVGQDAGYLQVTRLAGNGPALLVVPEKGTPFEAYLPLNEPMPRQQTFEGTFAWMAHSAAYAENEWKNAKPWNTPTRAILQPGETRLYGLKFLLAPSIREIENTLAAAKRPVAVTIPGTILPQDIEGKIFFKYPAKVKSIAVEPQEALHIEKAPVKNDWQAYVVRGAKWGRARLTVNYSDGTIQTVHFYVTKPAAQAVADMGRFMMTRQWFEKPNDPFGRSPSVMTFDRETNKIVEQDSRVWVSGLGDEGGSIWMAAAMKQFGQPNAEEIARYEKFIDGVLWGGLQYSDGPNKYGVRKSLMFYEPDKAPGFEYDPKLNWKSWTSWNKKHSEDIGRGYNYPHVVAAYWAYYRLARNTKGLVKNHDWDWYLNQAYETIMFAMSRDANRNRRVGWVELGLMAGDVFLDVLQDLKREGWTEKATALEARMKERADRWKNEEYPFGSEMAWDSTGQEEVYAWCKYFGHDEKAQVSLNSILGYMPTVPHWGYNGNARRYWDFLYAGKLSRIERQLHHYGSSLNAIPVLSEYRDQPDDFYLLRVGYGGMMGSLSNIDEEGFASAAFHSFPDTLRWDAISGDYAQNFYGHAHNSGTYIVNHPDFGWQAFGGNVRAQAESIRVDILDSFRQRVYIAPLGLWLTLDVGTFEAVVINPKTGTVRLALSPASKFCATARLRIEQPGKRANAGKYYPVGNLQRDAGAFNVPLSEKTTVLELKAN